MRADRAVRFADLDVNCGRPLRAPQLLSRAAVFDTHDGIRPFFVVKPLIQQKTLELATISYYNSGSRVPSGPLTDQLRRRSLRSTSLSSVLRSDPKNLKAQLFSVVLCVNKSSCVFSTSNALSTQLVVFGSVFLTVRKRFFFSKLSFFSNH